MVWTIARRELIDALRDARFRACAVIVLLLLAVALGAGAQHRRAHERHRTNAVEAERTAWVGQAPGNPHSGAHFGRYAFKPLMAAALVDPGVSPYLGVAVYVEGHQQNPFRYRPAEDASMWQAFGELTAAAVLQWLLPLVIILLAFGTFAEERETGTLKQVLALGVSPSALLAGKALGTALSLGLVVIPAAVLGAALLVAGSAEGWADATGRVLLMAGAYLAYLGGYLGLALGVSARAASARLALLFLLGFWIVSGLLVPRAAASIAEALFPTPSIGAFMEEVRADLENGVDGHRPPGEREQELKAALMRQYGVTSERDLPVNLTGYMLQQSEAHGNVVFDRRFSQLRGIYRRQQQVLYASALLAPVLAARSFSMGIAGTDLWEHETFASAAEHYRRSWVKRLNDDLTYNSRTGDTSYRVDRRFWDATPDFTYTPPGPLQAASTHRISALLLAAFLVSAWAFAGFAVRRLALTDGAAR